MRTDWVVHSEWLIRLFCHNAQTQSNALVDIYIRTGTVMRMLSPLNFGKRKVPSVRSIQRPTSVPRTELETALIFVGLPVRRIVIDTITLAPVSVLSLAAAL